MKIGIIGCGNMGEAVIKSHQLPVTSHQLIASDKSKKRRDYIRKKYRISVIKDNIELVKKSEIVILAIKPQDIKEVLGEIARNPFPPPTPRLRRAGATRNPLFISIAAGISTHFIASFFKSKVSIIRVMPNMPALIGEGISVLCKGKYVVDKDLNAAKKIFRVLGEVVEADEKDLNLITALSGSGPAYFFYFAEQLIKTGVSLGLKKDAAKKLIIQTGLGSLKMLAQGGDAKELRKKVTSKGGTTEAAFKIFQQKKIDKIFDEAIRAAVKKAKEISCKPQATSHRLEKRK